MQIKDPGAHLDHFMRQTRIHHVQLSAMADVKASMMITAASLVLTFSVRYLTVPAFQWATLRLILSCAASITSENTELTQSSTAREHRKFVVRRSSSTPSIRCARR